MRKKTTSIPVNYFDGEFDPGISIEKISFKDLTALGNDASNNLEDTGQSHRHDRHSFFLLESGIVHLEIDFKKYAISPSSVIYVHPNQVHRTTVLKNVIVYNWAINNENLNPDYLKLLEDITPAKPLVLKKETFSIIFEAVSLCIKFTERKNDKLYHSLLKDSCNALVALVVSQYLEQSALTSKLPRFEIVTKAFREILEHNYTTLKRPAAYAQQLNISTSYLNECVKNTTGHSVTHQIQQRVILEAKRLLYYSDRSVKEIANELGFDDYPYFSRLFTKVAGVSAMAFRQRNHD